tara:strand:- start:423 stop:602 length:180 start_codon:yes stop_codon:yes gene_type:complete
MNKLNIFNDSPLKKILNNEEDQKDNNSKDKTEKVLCNHCGRTASNGIRCKGFCVADNDY